MSAERVAHPAGDQGLGVLVAPSPRRLGPYRHRLATVAIVGGTATQRGHVARTFHTESPLRGGPFVAVDCHTDREPLRMALRAWTVAGGGPHTNPLFAAEEGTLYLDQVEDVPPDTQPSLLALVRRLQGGLVDEAGWPCAGRLVVGNPRALSAVVSEGYFDPALSDAIDDVRVELEPTAAALRSG